MVQRKTTCQATVSYNLQAETRFGQEHVIKSLGPEMMMMKRTKPKKKVIESPASQSSKPQSSPPKGTGMSPNYMKSTSSSEARKENKSRLSQAGPKKERSVNKPSSRIVRGLTKAPSFKRCSQKATCSSTLKDSKFPDYLMLHHGGTDGEVSGTSVLKVCPYTYCSLNGHLHKQYTPLKSFISSRRWSLKSQKSVQKEAYKEDVVEMCVEDGTGETIEVDVDTQISEALSEGAPCSEVDSDDYSDTAAEMMKFSESDDDIKLQESDMEETFVAESVKEIKETYEAEMVKTSEGDHGVESRQSDMEESLVDDDSVKESQETSCEDNDDSDSSEMVKTSEDDHGTESRESDKEESLVDDSVKESQETSCEVNDDSDSAEMVRFLEGDHDMELNEAYLEETLLDAAAEDCNKESQDQSKAIPMIEKTEKAPLNRNQKPCNQEGEDSGATISWTITKCKKPLTETEALKEFNPREPNYLPVAADADTEKVDLKHQDIDERKNSEDWMFDYALQRVVTKLSSARKRKVALLVEAFETVKPVTPHGREPAQVLSYGRHLQTCN